VRRDLERLHDMLEAIEKIERFTLGGRGEFEADERTQVWVLYHIQILGEAARALSRAARDGYPQIPWSAIIAMRHILVHDYFGIDLNEVWKVVEQDLPALRRQLEEVLSR
jgi:uncharacterized protein with HEPN domain